MFATLLFTSLATLAYLIYRFAYKPYSVLKKIGVKGPQPKAFFGNGKELKELGFMKFVEKYSKVYGSVWGYYLGRKAVIVVSDVEMLKQVTVKDFDSFINRCVFGITNIRNTRPGLLMLKDESWRNSRQTLTPTFSAMKMKQMVPLLQISCNTLVKKMGELATAGNSADVWRIFGSFTMESILAAAFGRLVNIQEGEADQLTTAAASTFIALQEGGGMSRYTVFPVIDQLPFLLPLFRYLFSRSSVAKATLLLNNTAIELVKARRNEHNTDRKFKDFLQLMIEATDDSSQKKLSNERIVGLARGFLLAGYETTSTALAYTAYLLALHPRVQERLYSEIDGIQEESMYEAVQKLEYLDMVIQETLRLYPPGYHTNRECMKTTVVGGITVPKGTIVEIPIYHIHRSPQYWDDPEKFDPGRFTAEEKAKRNPLCHIPFGFGPRNCIGFRFALMEAKMALIGILKKYKFVRTPETEVPLQLEAGITSAPKNGVYLKIVPRNDN